MHANHAYSAYKMHAYEIPVYSVHANHAYDAYEIHAYERYAYANHAYNAYERHAYEMAYGRCTPIGDTRL